MLRPSIVVGPHTVGAKDQLPGPLGPRARRLTRLTDELRLPAPVLVPALPLQLVHEEDMGQALLRCIAADGIITAGDIARELGLLPLPLPAGPAQFTARAFAIPPFPPPIAQWSEAASHPAIMDTTRAKRELGWAPRFTALEALRDTLRPGRGR